MPLVIAVLTTIAVAGFVLVSHLVTRYRANGKQIAWHVFERGLEQAKAGNPARALDDFRAALTYDPENTQYQLSLARALRDAGRLSESQTYLLSLWERAPQDSTINLALARLSARRHDVEDAIRYYHNAIYGIWEQAPDANRREARLELIEFLLEQHALPQARAELLSMAQTLPADPGLHLEVAAFFMRAGDQEQALSQYLEVLRLDRRDHGACAGAGEAAFQLRRYNLAQRYLRVATEIDPADAKSKQLLETAMLVLAADPFHGRLSDAERNRRLSAAFEQVGHRLQSCAEARQVDLGAASGNPLQDLSRQWNQLQPQLRQLRAPAEADLPDKIMDLVSAIEQTTAEQCGAPTGLDLALSLISRQPEAD
jgi:tetratricopeptide (TPR) repeat protein